ncbi:MAG TPA: Gfo/Idh/MocA family oxidoreductase [Dehalococcoidia bacterium]|jgi:predicted dehydrogenase|nr:Gfo/Idh/MocA family oxidoreductase [Dehalococcoidia bacterium]HIK89864.1 Gfo/Idh/MocA family oxidoreductase [Dehalococcoidia bacterium]
MPEKLRMAQYGTKHGHAEGVLQVMLDHPEVEVVGVYEPDAVRREQVENSGSWANVDFIDDPDDFLDDPMVDCVTSEGANKESLGFTEEIVAAGKHVFYDKPAGDDYPRFEHIIEIARAQGTMIQMGYMFRKHDGFERIANWARSGFLGDIFQVRAHMSTWIPEKNPEGQFTGREGLAHHKGGVMYDLGGHMLDQVVWILGRPNRVSRFFQNATSENRDVMDNTLGVFEYGNAIATVDIAAMETRPMARRFEVYGTKGSAIMEPFEPADTIRLTLGEDQGEYKKGVNTVKIEHRARYVDTFAELVRNIKGESEPLRTLDHELLVQETLMRVTGGLSG